MSFPSTWPQALLQNVHQCCPEFQCVFCRCLPVLLYKVLCFSAVAKVAHNAAGGILLCRSFAIIKILSQSHFLVCAHASVAFCICDVYHFVHSKLSLCAPLHHVVSRSSLYHWKLSCFVPSLCVHFRCMLFFRDIQPSAFLYCNFLKYDFFKSLFILFCRTTSVVCTFSHPRIFRIFIYGKFSCAAGELCTVSYIKVDDYPSTLPLFVWQIRPGRWLELISMLSRRLVRDYKFYLQGWLLYLTRFRRFWRHVL